MSTESPINGGSRLERALTWLLKTAIRFIVLLALLLALAFAVQFGLQQLDISLNNISGRVALLRSDVNHLQGSDDLQRQQIGDLQATVSVQQRQLDATSDGLTAAEESLAAGLTRQEERLAALEAQAAELAAVDETMAQDVASNGAGLGALQGDINDNSLRLDQLGGQFDGLETQLATMAGEMDNLAENIVSPEEDLQQFSRALFLFRIWELVARARLRLVENNPGLATTDVATAVLALESLAGSGTEEEAAALQPVQDRLDLALVSLATDPGAAARDLESAWEEIDVLLISLLGFEEISPPNPPEQQAPAETPTVEVAPTATPSP